MFKSIFLIFNDKDLNRYLFTAQTGVLQKDFLLLTDGSVCNIGKRHYSATFDQTEICLDKLLGKESVGNFQQQLKFMSWKSLVHLKNKQDDVLVEFHKRISQVLWQLLIPFFSFFGILIFGRRKNNAVKSIVFTGITFLVMHAILVVGQALCNNLILAISLLYGFPLAILLIVVLLYKFRFNL
jgi:lipopolysaccharide export LptBFGC system permease protein LptF